MCFLLFTETFFIRGGQMKDKHIFRWELQEYADSPPIFHPTISKGV